MESIILEANVAGMEKLRVVDDVLARSRVGGDDGSWAEPVMGDRSHWER